MRKLAISLCFFVAGCSAAVQPVAPQQTAQAVQMYQVTPVATTLTGALGQAIDVGDCSILGMASPAIFLTSQTLSYTMPFIGGIGGKFVCTLVKAVMSPPSQTVAVQH